LNFVSITRVFESSPIFVILFKCINLVCVRARARVYVCVCVCACVSLCVFGVCNNEKCSPSSMMDSVNLILV